MFLRCFRLLCKIIRWQSICHTAFVPNDWMKSLLITEFENVIHRTLCAYIKSPKNCEWIAMQSLSLSLSRSVCLSAAYLCNIAQLWFTVLLLRQHCICTYINFYTYHSATTTRPKHVLCLCVCGGSTAFRLSSHSFTSMLSQTDRENMRSMIIDWIVVCGHKVHFVCSADSRNGVFVCVFFAEVSVHSRC